MNKLALSIFVALLLIGRMQAQVKIGSAGTPNSNAVLELDGGTSKGLLLPKLTATEITALSTAPDGLIASQAQGSSPFFPVTNLNNPWGIIYSILRTSYSLIHDIPCACYYHSWN